MAKIRFTKYPCSIVRENDTVTVTLDETQGEIQKEQNITNLDSKTILSLSKEIADANSMEFAIAKKVLSPGQETLNSFIILQKLIE